MQLVLARQERPRAASSSSWFFHWLAWIRCSAPTAAISWSALLPLIASMATLALNSGLWVRRLLNSFGEGYAYGGSPLSGVVPRLRG